MIKGQKRSPLRLIFTYDLFGAFAPDPTSYGRLPGARALQEHVDRLREDAAVNAWIDGGDFSAGGSLAPATGHELGWAAAGDLGIDAGVPGNHDFDFGDDVFAQRAEALPFRLFAVDLPGHEQPVIIEGPGGPVVAVLGVCFPERRGHLVYTRDPDHAAAVERVREAADSLRKDVDHIVVAMHDGLPEGEHEPARSPVGAFCAALRGHVSAVFGAHTMARHVGDLGGLPYLQPWPLGSEVAVLDVFDDRLEPWLSPVTGHRPWDGPGADLLADLQAEIVAENRHTRYSPARNATPGLSMATAEGLRAAADADLALVNVMDTAWMQPRRDGVGGYLPAGPVSRAQLLRVLPWASSAGDHAWAAHLTAPQWDALVIACTERYGPAEIARREPTSEEGRVALGSTRVDLARVVVPDVEWEPLPLNLRDGLLHTLHAAT